MARDYTREQFEARLAKWGWERDDNPLWIAFRHRDFPGASIGGVVDRRTFKLNRRATLAHLIAERSRLARIYKPRR